MSARSMTPPPSADTPSAGGEFRSDLQGLRGVAILAVVLYHAAVPGMSGGFAGVDVFFVLSGFLITGILRREVERTGGVGMLRFYGNRARRLLPSAVLVVLATAGASVLLLPPLQARSALHGALASVLYANNYRLALDGTDYLQAGSAPAPFQHYWSLGVEEQFYLVWPALIIAVAWAVRDGVRARRATLPYAGVLLVLAGSSFALSLWWTRAQPSWAFFSLPTRAWELAAGGLVALTAPWWGRLPRAVREALGLAGLAAVVLGYLRYGEGTPWPGAAALAPVLGSALVIAAGCGTVVTAAGRTLGLPPLRTAGRYSYSWYLWHWPALILAPYLLGRPLSLPARLASVAGAGLLAVLTTHAVEDPLRFRPWLRRSPARSLGLGAVTTAAGLAAALLLPVVLPPIKGSGAAVATPRLHTAGSPAAPSPSGPTGPPPPDPAQVRISSLVAQVQQALAASADMGAVPSDLAPALDKTYDAVAPPFLDGCLRPFTAPSQATCASAATASATTMALIGDSHAAMWYPAMESIAEQRQWRLETITKSGCPMLDLPMQSPELHRAYTECTVWRQSTLARLAAERPAVVVVDDFRGYTPDAFGVHVYSDQWLSALGDLVRQLRADGSTVLVLGPVPILGQFIPPCLSANLTSAAACGHDRAQAVDETGVAAEDQVTTQAGGHYLTLTDLFCAPTRCPVVVGNLLVYRDDQHVTPQYVGYLTPAITAMVDAALGGG